MVSASPFPEGSRPPLSPQPRMPSFLTSYPMPQWAATVALGLAGAVLLLLLGATLVS